MRAHFYGTKEDVQWLRETHLSHLEAKESDWIQSFVLSGNDDCPERIEAFSEQTPKYNTLPSQVFTMDAERLLQPRYGSITGRIADRV